ncbi:MAG TPA: EAL domain-containing protein [Solirubrobacter sp.]|nr:EAL domain-containing protein [Solirubrobacter sp.]
MAAEEVGADAVVAAFQPIVDLRDECVVGYEALARPRDGRPPAELLAEARASGRLGEVDRACRTAALRAAAAAGLGAPFALFLNADAGALELDVPDLPPGGATLFMEITESALTERPEVVLRTLTRLRTRGWGVSLDDVGGDSRSLAVMPLLYPDVIKLDLRLLTQRDPLDVARVVTAVGAEAERRRATVLAEGIDSEGQLEMARAAGATLGQGFLLGEPAPLPSPLPPPGRPLRLAGSGGDPSGPLPYQRVTNWRRPTRGALALAERAAALLTGQASALGPTGMLLAAPDTAHSPARYEALRGSLGFVGVLEPGALEDTWTEVALGPGYGACFVARRDGDGTWSFAMSYDRELVVECALLLMARLPRPARR